MHRPSDQDVNWMSPVQGKSPPVQVKEPYGNFDMVTCRLSSCNPDAVYKERKKEIVPLVCQTVLDPDQDPVIHLQFWAYWVLGLAVSHINESNCKNYESRTHFLMTSLQYYCILGLAVIETLHTRDKFMRKRSRMRR